MVAFLLTFLVASAPVDTTPDVTGTIRGIVVNGSRADTPVSNATVVLRAGQGGFFEVVAQTTTDRNGQFTYDQLPLDPAITYLPGADRDGVHYPGKRLQLGRIRPTAEVRLRTFDARHAPSPLQALRHVIDVSVDDDSMVITEAMRVANESTTAFVGEPVQDGQATTLRLTIPPNFERITFGSEFFGRRFRIVDHQPVTDVPWPPGERELKFTYRIPLVESGGQLHRTLDMPTGSLALRVRGAGTKVVTCNLPQVLSSDSETVYASRIEELPSGYSLELQVGDLPVPWALYGRWAAIVAFFVLTLGTVGWSRVNRLRRHVHEPENTCSKSRDTAGRRSQAAA